jgi:hypothetical protein
MVASNINSDATIRASFSGSVCEKEKEESQNEVGPEQKN